jgi:hypothetical protein
MLGLIKNKYYIVRYGDFATNGNIKLMYGLFSLVLCIHDYISHNSNDCFIILLGSTSIWTIVEFYLHMSRTRIIKPMFITLGADKYELSQYSGIILQGLQEGGLVTTLGLYFGDRIFDLYSIIFLHIFILFTIWNIYTRTINNNISLNSSKRQVNTPVSLIFIGSLTIYDILTLYNNPEHIYRQLYMIIIMTYVCSIWTYFAWYKGFRSTEIHIINNNIIIDSKQMLESYNIKPVTKLDTFYILAYDVFFEIGLAYILFYNLFLI